MTSDDQVPNVAPILGELAFFIGIPQTSTVKARPDGDVHLLVLSKEDNDELLRNYPEQVSVVETFGIFVNHKNPCCSMK